MIFYYNNIKYHNNKEKY